MNQVGKHTREGRAGGLAQVWAWLGVLGPGRSSPLPGQGVKEWDLRALKERGNAATHSIAE